jgi:FRG domain
MSSEQHISPNFLKKYDLQEASNFLELLQKLSASSSDFLFRGCGNANHDLVPSALREYGWNKLKQIFKTLQPNSENYPIQYDSDRAIIEYVALSQFYSMSNRQGLSLPAVRHDVHEFMVNRATQSNALVKLQSDFSGKIKWPLDNFEQPLGVAQHYGLPTRLLDWSDDMFVATYFAAKASIAKLNEAATDATHLAVWIISRSQINTLSIENDSNNALPSRIKLIDVPYAGNPNLAAQKGSFSLVVPRRDDPKQFTPAENFSLLFALNEIDQKISADYKMQVFGELAKPFVLKLTLPIVKSKELMKLLHGRGYDYARIYPGYAGSVGQIDELLDL